MRYEIKTVEIPQWDKVEKAPIVKCLWSPNDAPAAELQAVYTTQGHLLFRVTSHALPTRAVNFEPDSRVWEDSCLECFLSFDGKNYANLEANANSALRASFGPGRHGRSFVRDITEAVPVVKAQVYENGWAVTFDIAPEMVRQLWGVELCPGLEFTGNFYSCGDETPSPHFASWNEVGTPTPDFHRPEFFGELVIV